MKRIFTISLLLFLLSFSAKLQAQFTKEQIQFWVGEGSNSAMLVVDFRDGTSDPSYVWGYRYNDGEGLTLKTMLEAVAAAEPKFTMEQSGGFLNGITYNTHSQSSGSDWWSTWAGESAKEMQMNMGLGDPLVNDKWFGLSYGFSPQPEVPTTTYPAYHSLWFDAEDVTFWVGEGENKSVIVIDFNQGEVTPTTYAWGIKYNGTITAENALALIDAADTNLELSFSEGKITGATYKSLSPVLSGGKGWNTFKGTNMSDWVINTGISSELTNGDWYGTTFGPTSARRPFIPTAAEETTNGLINHNAISFSVYPNPVESILNIKSDNTILKVEVFNIAGQHVLTSLNSDVINLGAVTPGIYFVKAYSDTGIATHKVIKK